MKMKVKLSSNLTAVIRKSFRIWSSWIATDCDLKNSV
jgi:hypothetical protein